MTDAELQKLGKQCNENFRQILGMVNQVKDRQQDASAKELIEDIVGQPVILRRKDGGDEFLLDIPRFRAPRKATTKPNANGLVDAKTHLVLWVDGERADGANFGDQCNQAFGWTAKELMAKIADAAETANTEADNGRGRNWDRDTEYTIMHDGNEYPVEVSAEED